MKNRLIITVSDINSTRSYNVHQLARKFLFIFILVIFVLLAASFWFISSLRDDIKEAKNIKNIQEKQLLSLQEDIKNIKISKEKQLKELRVDIANLKRNKKRELKILLDKENKLLNQNKLYSKQIKNKIQNIEELSSKLDEIYDIIGTNENPTKEEITKKTLEAIDLNKKKYTLQTIPNGNPLERKFTVSSNFGYRKNPITKRRQFHRGLDMVVPLGTTIRATADGVVSLARNKNIGDYGRVVSISHNFGFSTTFAHMNKVIVKTGDIIKKNQIIGYSGNSGRSSGAHLHYEVRFGNQVLNPRHFIFWNLKEYDSLFKKERRIQWESLIKLINTQHKMVQLL